MNSDNCNTCIWKKGNSCTQPCTGTIIKEKDQEIAFLTDIAATRFEHMKAQGKEIAELKAENLGYDKALSGFRMWLSAKNRENVLLDPDEVKGELEQRIKESKETERKEGMNDE
jgi:hypothetical protein